MVSRVQKLCFNEYYDLFLTTWVYGIIAYCHIFTKQTMNSFDILLFFVGREVQVLHLRQTPCKIALRSALCCPLMVLQPVPEMRLSRSAMVMQPIQVFQCTQVLQDLPTIQTIHVLNDCLNFLPDKHNIQLEE